MIGNRVKVQVHRATHYLVLGIAVVLAAATLGILSPSRAFAASAFVQDRDTEVTSGTTASLAFSKANTAGDLIVVYVVWDNPGSVTVSDSKGDVYTAATARQSWGEGWSAQVFYAPNIVGGTNTVKATFGTSITSFGLLYLHEYSGLATSSAVDVSASAVGTAASMSSGAVTTTQADDLLFGAGASDITATKGTNFTARLTGFGNITEDRVVTATGSYAATASQNGTTWVMQLVAFRVASGTAGTPTKLAFLQGPTTTAAGAAMTPAVKVAVEDANGNIETSDNATQVSLAIGNDPDTGVLSGGSAVTVVSGVATFPGLSINQADNGYTLVASSTPSYSAATSAAFNITPGVPTRLAIFQEPSNTAAGSTMAPAVEVAVEDANGNIETSDNATQVSLAIGTNPAGGTLSGGAAVTVVTGIASFPALSINDAGNGYTLVASSSPSYTPATSAAFNISASTAGPPAKLAFLQGPSNTVAGSTMAPAVKVAVEDANGNIETSDNGTQVSLAIGTNPAGGTLSGGSAITVASGIATFPALSINVAGNGYTLTATSTPSYTAATSAAFNITTGTSADWTSFMNGNDRSGDNSGNTGINPTTAPHLQLAWKASDTAPNHGVFTQPIVSNGVVYWGSFDGYERATSASSGKLLWQTNLGTTSPPACTDPSEAGVASTAALTTDVPVDGATSVLYLGGGNSTIYALNAATGAVLWSYNVGGNPNTFVWSSPAVSGNSVYIGVSSFGSCPDVQGELLQLNRVTGAVQNTFDVVPNGCIGGGVWSSPTIDAAAGTIYFTTGNQDTCTTTEMAPAIVEVSASNLSLLGSWTVPKAQQTCCGDGDWAATPTLFNGVIDGQSEPMVGSIEKNGIFYAFERGALSSGPVWSTRIAIGGENPTTGSGDIAPAAWDGTTLYVGGDITNSCAGTVNALNPSTGAFIWQHCFAEGPVLGAVTTSGGVVAVGEGTNIEVLSAATGATVFTYTGVGPFWGGSSIADGSLYEGDMAGNLYALTPSQTTSAQFVQVNSATPQTSESTVAVPYTQAQAAGDLNVVAVGFNDSTSTITSVTDSAGNVYQLAAPLTRGSGISQAIYYAKDVNPAAAGKNVVTVQFSAAAAYPDVRVAEYSGLDPVSPLDTSASASGTSATASSGNLTTSAANEMIFGAGMTTSLFLGGTNGFASRIITSPDGDIAGDEFESTAGTYAATATVADSSAWVMQAVAFHVG